MQQVDPDAVARTLARLGGVAVWRELVAVHTRPEIEAALATGVIARPRRGHYTTPALADARAAAVRLSGVATLHSAAAHWRWKMQWVPRQPSIALVRGRRTTTDQRAGVTVSWRSIPPADVVDGWVTSRERTLLDCAAALPFAEALAIADSALRSRQLDLSIVRDRADDLPARGPRRRILRVLLAASPDAAGPFESVLRAILLDIPGVLFVPQVRIDDAAGFVGRVDLAEERLRIVVEGESLEFHGESEAFDRDCARYSRLTADGWLVLRFSWTQVMTKPDWVRRIVARTVDLRRAA